MFGRKEFESTTQRYIQEDLNLAMKVIKQTVFLWLNHLEEKCDERCRASACECSTSPCRIRNPKW
jgi:hypothetical protein